MPSSSKKQHNFMAAVAHSPSFARKVGVPQSVGKDFTEADKGKKFMNPRARKKGGALGYAPGGKVDWSANEANAMKPGEKQLGYGKEEPTPKKSSKDSFNRDSITAEGRAKGVDFDKYGRVKAPSSVASDMVKKGAKFALDASPFGGIRKAGESVKKLLTTKTTKRPASVGKGGLAYKNDSSDVVDRALKSGLKPGTPKFSSFIATNGGRDSADNKKAKKYAEGGPIVPGTLKGTGAGAGQTKGDTEKQTDSGDVNKPVTTKSEESRGFFGKIFKRRSKNVGPDGQDWKKLDKTPESSFDEDEESEGVKKYKESLKSDEDTMSEQAKSNIEKKTSGAPEQKKQSFKAAFAAAKGKNFTWNGKKYSGAKKASAPKAKTATTKKVDTTVDKRENNRLRQSNPVYWDAAKKVANNKPASSTAPKKPTNPRGSMAGKTASAPAKNARGSMSGFTPSKNKAYNYAAGGSIQAFKKGGLVGSRADGIASRGRTKCKIR